MQKIKEFIRQGDVQQIRQLIDEGWSPNAYFESGHTPLSLAAACADEEMIRLLLMAGADVNQPEKDLLACTPLICAILKREAENLSIVKLLVDQGADLEKGDSRNWTPLFYACTHAYYDTTLYLLKKGANPNAEDYKGCAPLNCLCESVITPRNSHYGIIEEEEGTQNLSILLEKGAEIDHANLNGGTPLYFAAVNGAKQFLNILLQKGADVNCDGGQLNFPIFAAAESGDWDCAYLLLQGGAEVSVTDPYGMSPLMMAVLSGNITLVKLFLEHGADTKQAVSSSFKKIEAIYNKVAPNDTAEVIARKMERDDMAELIRSFEK